MENDKVSQCVEEISSIINEHELTMSQINKILAHIQIRADSTAKHSVLKLDKFFDTNEVCKL